MLLSEDHLAVQDAVRNFVQAEIAPHAAAWDKSHQFPAAQLKGLNRRIYFCEFQNDGPCAIL